MDHGAAPAIRCFVSVRTRSKSLREARRAGLKTTISWPNVSAMHAQKMACAPTSGQSVARAWMARRTIENVFPCAANAQSLSKTARGRGFERVQAARVSRSGAESK